MLSFFNFQSTVKCIYTLIIYFSKPILEASACVCVLLYFKNERINKHQTQNLCVVYGFVKYINFAFGISYYGKAIVYLVFGEKALDDTRSINI